MYRCTAESTHPLFVPPRTFSLVRHWKRWGLRQACRLTRQDDGESELVQPGFVLPLAWDKKIIVPTRTCRVCSLLRFDGKKWCFSRLSDSSSPLPFLDRSFFDRFKRSASIQMTGPSHAACNNGCDLHVRWDRYRDAACYAHVAQARDLSSLHAPLFGLRLAVRLNFFGRGSSM